MSASDKAKLDGLSTGGGGGTTITADTYIYLRVDGNDANDGLVDSPSCAVRTIDGAITAANKVYTHRFGLGFKFGPGEYGGTTISAPFVSGGPRGPWRALTLLGQENHTAIIHGLIVKGEGTIVIQNLAFDETLNVAEGCTCTCKNVLFHSGIPTCISASRSSVFFATQASTIKGSHERGIYLEHSQLGFGVPINFQDNATFNECFVYMYLSWLHPFPAGFQFGGSFTGRRFKLNTSWIESIDSPGLDPMVPGTISSEILTYYIEYHGSLLNNLTPTRWNQLTNKGYVDGALSKAQTGYMRFGNGLIIQWGWINASDSPTDITFPVAFSAWYSYGFTISTVNGVSGKVYGTANMSTTGLKVYRVNVTGGGEQMNASWIAIGY
jgi:hypothetical protein